MTRSLRAAVVSTGLIFALSGCSPPVQRKLDAPVASAVRLDGVTVVDTHDGSLKPGMSILMDRGQIVSISPTPEAMNAPSVRIIDATGKFVVPGFNNMHSHALGPKDPSGALAIMLTEGVTGFRQMSGSPELLKERRSGTLPIGPDAPALLAMPGNLLTPFNTGTVEDTKAEIQRQKADGADFIKIGLVSPTAFYVAIAEAHRVGLSAVGHLQEGVDPAQASRSGFNGIEHLGPGDTVWIGCSTQEAALLKEAAERPAIKAPPFKIPFLERIVMHQLETRLINPAAFDDPVNVQRLQRALDSYDDSKCRSLGAQFIKDTTWQTPTLVRLRTQYLADDPAYQSDPALAYQPKAATKAWRKVLDRFRKLPASMRQTYRVAYQGQLKLTKLFADQGVPMMAGTDGGGVVPGQSLHQEFDELAKAGLSPLKILQMTTLNGAQFLGRTATMGSVEVGKTADLVLLDANPVATVHNLHGISGVVRAGRYYSRADLDRLKQRVVSGDGRF